MYLTTIKPNLTYVVFFISRSIIRTTELYLQATKNGVKVLKGYCGFKRRIDGTADSDYAKDVDDMKITYRYVFQNRT